MTPLPELHLLKHTLAQAHTHTQDKELSYLVCNIELKPSITNTQSYTHTHKHAARCTNKQVCPYPGERLTVISEETFKDLSLTLWARLLLVSWVTRQEEQKWEKKRERLESYTDREREKELETLTKSVWLFLGKKNK